MSCVGGGATVKVAATVQVAWQGPLYKWHGRGHCTSGMAGATVKVAAAVQVAWRGRCESGALQVHPRTEQAQQRTARLGRLLRCQRRKKCEDFASFFGAAIQRRNWLRVAAGLFC